MLTKKSRRSVSVLCLTMISVLVLSALVSASPDIFTSHPSAYHVVDLTVALPDKAYDGDTGTKATTSYASGAGYGGPGEFHLKGFDGSLPFGSAISQVTFVIYYKTTLSSIDATYEIAWFLDNTKKETIRGPAREAVDYTTTPLKYNASISLTWDDIGKLSVRYITADGRRSDTGGMLYVHEVWLDITYTPVEIRVDPPTQDVTASFTCDINITGPDKLYAWEFKLYYDTTILTATGVTEGTFFTGAGKSTYFKEIERNDTTGLVWASCTITGNVSGVTDEGILATVSFDLDGPSGTSPLDLQDTKLVGYDMHNISSIPHTAYDGAATVPAAPEFPLGLALEIALIPAIIYVFLKTRRKIKHHNNPPTSTRP